MKHIINKLTTKEFIKIAAVSFVAYLAGMLSLMVCYLISISYFDSDNLIPLEYCLPYFLFMYALALLFSAGLQATCSRYAGANKKEVSVKIFFVSTAFIMVFVVLLALFSFIFNERLLIGLGVYADSEYFELATRLIKCFIVGGPAIVLNMLLISAFQMESKIKIVTVGGVVLVIVNLVVMLAYVSTGTATFENLWFINNCSFYVSALMMILYIIFGKQLKLFTFKNFISSSAKFKPLHLFEVIKEGFPNAIAQICTTILTWSSNLLIGAYCGEDYLTVLFLLDGIASLALAISSSFGSSTLIMTSYQYELKKPTEDIFKTFIFFSIVSYLVVTLLLIFTAQPLSYWLLEDSPELVSVTTYAIKVYSISLMPTCICVSWRNYLQGRERMLATQVICILQNFVLNFIAIYLILEFWDPTQVWFNNLFASCVLLAALVIAKICIKEKLLETAK